MLLLGAYNSDSSNNEIISNDHPVEKIHAPLMPPLPDEITKCMMSFLSAQDLVAFGLTNSKILKIAKPLKIEKELIDFYNEFTAKFQCSEVAMSRSKKCLENCKMLEYGSDAKMEALIRAFLLLCEQQSHFNLKNEVLDPYPACYKYRLLVRRLFQQTDANAQASFILKTTFANNDNKEAMADEKYALAYLDVVENNLIAPENLFLDGTIDKKLENALLESIRGNRSIRKIAFIFGNFADSEFASKILAEINKNPYIKEIEILGSPSTFHEALRDLSEDGKTKFAEEKLAKIVRNEFLDVAQVIYETILHHISLEHIVMNAWHPKAVIYLNKPARAETNGDDDAFDLC